jgi:CreA protein
VPPIEYTPENMVISVGVTDYDRSLAWYRDLLGFELDYELKEYGWCELKTPFGPSVGLGQTEQVTPGSTVPTFGVRDLDQARAHLERTGVRFDETSEVPGMVRLASFYDPDGNPWMLAQVLDGDKSSRGS